MKTEKTETEKEKLAALALLHQAMVDIALASDYIHPQRMARTALARLAIEHPEVVELLLARAAEGGRGERVGSTGE